MKISSCFIVLLGIFCLSACQPNKNEQDSQSQVQIEANSPTQSLDNSATAVSVIADPTRGEIAADFSTAPSTPKNIRIQAESATSLRLSWDAVENAVIYNIYRLKNDKYVLVNSVEYPTYADRELSAGVYFYRINAANLRGSSTLSDTITGNTLADFRAVQTFSLPADSQIPTTSSVRPFRLALGSQHACALMNNFSLRCWGLGTAGQLGNATTSSLNTPTTVTVLSQVAQIALGGEHSCAILTNDVVQCWGAGTNGQLGYGGNTNQALPFTVNNLTKPTQLALGSSHSCALQNENTLRCWGLNSSGQLGNGSITSANSPQAVTGLTTVVNVVAGDQHTCALLTDATARCWGLNGSGQVGNGSTVNQTTPVGVGLSNVTQISTGKGHTCALLSDNTVRCWGLGTSGQIGNGGGSVTSPTTVLGITTAVQIAVGENHSCALLSNGSIKCWGDNYYGQLGNGSLASIQNIPVDVIGLNSVRQIVAGLAFTCALLQDQSVRCWGSRLNGKLGDGLFTESSVPINANINNVAQISAGNEHTCALLMDGTVYCWGEGIFGQVGHGLNLIAQNPTRLSTLSAISKIATGRNFSCALASDKSGKCWGLGNEYQLGNGINTANSNVPVTVVSLSKATQIGLGDAHACALIEDASNSVKCWGRGSNGQIGNGSALTQTTPTTVSNLTAPTAITANGDHSCVILATGEAWCWGDGSDYQLGNSSNVTPRTVPVQVSAQSLAISQISAGDSHSCMVLADGNPRCWGLNSSGQIGNNSTNQAIGISLITGMHGIGLVDTSFIKLSNIQSGFNSTCGIVTDGTVRCWGNGANGKLGNGLTTNQLTSVLITGLTNVTQLTVGESHACALMSDKTVKCWGNNSKGQLGNSNAFSALPTVLNGL